MIQTLQTTCGELGLRKITIASIATRGEEGTYAGRLIYWCWRHKRVSVLLLLVSQRGTKQASSGK